MTNPNSMLLPIAESFHSYQGEGDWTGTPMFFIRTAGCSVGQHPEHVKWEIGQDKDFPILKTGYPAYRCHTYDGRGFWCDTDFHKGVFMSIDTLIESTWEKHICITGGEPLLHKEKLEVLVRAAYIQGIFVHIETSVTIDWSCNAWITVSPKQGYLSTMIQRANELKLLIDPSFKLGDVPMEILQHENVFVQPVNAELEVDFDNLQLCYNILREMPRWRLSVQLHKFLRVR